MDSKTLCLGVLMLGDASGYEIKKHFAEGPFAHFHAVGFGSIYPALGTLLRDGLVTCTPTPQDRRPVKKVYSLTEAGRSAFRRALHVPPAPDVLRSDAMFILYFAEQLDAGHARAVLDNYLTLYRERVAFMERLKHECDAGCAIGPGRRFMRGLGLALYRAAADYMEAHRDELLSELDAEPPRGAGGQVTARAAE